ncbi:MAG: hypothetical protein OK456_04815 [Thaumarchaeota archaeon]|nr:hypothetical protein [Nitrososphaerota archaeon]
MSISLTLILVVAVTEVLPSAVFLYAGYWALSVRRALVSRIYRNESLWLGAVALSLSAAVFLTYSTNTVITDAINIYFSVFYVILFAFLDSVIPVVRRSDPLLRSILRWEKLRYVLWADLGVLVAFQVLPGVFPSLSTGTAGYALMDGGWFVVASILYGLSGLAVLTGAKRSRDMTLRSSLKWIGACILLAVGLFTVYTLEYTLLPNLTQFEFFYSYPAVPVGLAYILIAYALYRSARSLAPISRLQTDG